MHPAKFLWEVVGVKEKCFHALSPAHTENVLITLVGLNAAS